MKEFDIGQNVVLILFIIGCLIYFIISRYMNDLKDATREQESFQEGLDDIGKQIKNAFERPVREIGDKMRGGFDQIGNSMKGPFGQIGDIFDKIRRAFVDIPKRFNRIGSGFKGVFEGIGMEVDGTFRGVKRGFDDIGTLLNYSFELVRTYLFCGVKFLQNLHHCIFYYMIDMVLSIMYIPVSFSLWALKFFTGRDLYGLEKQAWNALYWLNDYIYGVAGFNIAKWPKNVRNLCYNCKRLKLSAIDNKANEVNKDFNGRIANDLTAGIKRISEGGNEFMRAFGNNP